ncbi:hypothetical protein M472_14790 [Sphingobacterium paucimobilis HER1398]|uniref:Uncharacterized protein n=1 Tax=Sphingobacterium paucimobilis HER1398 TaxID=1346330 RepID=U2J530_9SPHI|nr:hypothetical protein M472_14790 [Sphingobacterium paucimobilis HER1398]
MDKDNKKAFSQKCACQDKLPIIFEQEQGKWPSTLVKPNPTYSVNTNKRIAEAQNPYLRVFGKNNNMPVSNSTPGTT